MKIDNDVQAVINEMATPIAKYRRKVKAQCDVYLEHMINVLLWPWRSSTDHWFTEIHAVVVYASDVLISTNNGTRRPTVDELWKWYVLEACQLGTTLYSLVDNRNECGSTSKMSEAPRRDKSVADLVKILEEAIRQHLALVASGSYSKALADDILTKYLIDTQPEIMIEHPMLY